MRSYATSFFLPKSPCSKRVHIGVDDTLSPPNQATFRSFSSCLQSTPGSSICPDLVLGLCRKAVVNTLSSRTLAVELIAFTREHAPILASQRAGRALWLRVLAWRKFRTRRSSLNARRGNIWRWLLSTDGPNRCSWGRIMRCRWGWYCLSVVRSGVGTARGGLGWVLWFCKLVDI